jgi:hypothetical protein
VRKGLFGLLCATITLVVPAPPSAAGEIGLRWAGSPGAAGYRVLYGTSSGDLSRVVDVGNVTRTTLAELSDCETWYFGVKAYNAAGESALSNVVGTWPRPELRSINETAAKQGSQFPLTLTGANFPADTELAIDNPNVRFDSITVACDRISAMVTVEPTTEAVRAAEVGVFDLRVKNLSDGLEATTAFEVLIDPARFDVNQSDDFTTDRLDGKDTVWLARRFGTCMIPASAAKPCPPRAEDGRYDPRFDFSGDGWVDGDELSILGSNLGACWNGSAWSDSACGNGAGGGS